MSCNEKLRARKRRDEFPFPVDGSIGTKHRSGPRASLPPRRWSKTGPTTGPTTGCRRSFNALSFRIFSFPLSSPLFFLLPSVLVSRALPLVCFSRRDDWRIDSVREAGTKGGAVWPSPSCLRGPKVMWRRRLARRRRRASFRLACRFPPIGQSMRFSLSRPTWLNLEIRVCALWLVLIFGHCGAFVTVWYRISIFNGGEKWMMRVLKSMIL